MKLITAFFMAMIALINDTGAQDKLNIVVIGAHPDDADAMAGGTAIRYAKAGHRVLFVSLTNGNAGHQVKKGKELAAIRLNEAREAGKRFGLTYEVLNNNDGELMPTLDVRKDVIRLVREWKADVVIGPRPNDYHPDHRNTAVVIQDAAYMVMVPNVVPATPPLRRNPVFLYAQDHFQKPAPFAPDIAVDISGVIDQKIYAMSAHRSQFFDWLPWISGKLQEVPKTDAERLSWLKEQRRRPISAALRASLIKWYGAEKAQGITDAEAFEISEYGSRPGEQEIKRLFPFFEE